MKCHPLVLLSTLLVAACSSGPNAPSIGTQTSSSPEQVAQCDIVDAGLDPTQWHELTDSTLGISIRYPGFVEAHTREKILIKNYQNCKNDNPLFEKGQYVLQIEEMLFVGGRTCEGVYPDFAKNTLPSGAIALRGVKKAGEPGWDYAGNTFILCIDTPKKSIGFFIVENSDSGTLANQILDTVQLIGSK